MGGDPPQPPRAWLIDKPAGPTSHDMVARMRRRLPRRTKVGHAGTLDPFATGLLVVLSGRATRLARVLSDRPKRYRATVRLGARSVTGDPEGPITPGGPVPPWERVRQVAAGFEGAQMQRVPAFAAVKVDGERLYARARRGEDVTAPRRPIVVYDLSVIAEHADPPEIVIETTVSKGTYLRQIAVDIGERLGCGAYCAQLRRLAVGGLSVDDAVAVDDADPANAVPLHALLGHLPARDLTGPEAADVAFGRAVPGAEAGEVVLRHDGEMVALAVGDGHALRPTVVLCDPPGRAS